MNFILNFKKKQRIILILSIVIFFTFLILLYFYHSIDKEIDLSLIKSGGTSITKIYYFEDNESADLSKAIELKEEELFLQKSEWKSIYEIPKNLINAFVAVEDKRFYEHNGVDWLRTIKATSNYVLKFDKKHYGGSTITQQLVKNLTGENEVSAKRKIEEIFRAINIEKKLGKNEILESYLNIVYLSENCYGVGAASDLYFNKSIKDLTLKECVALASIVQNPTKYDPYTNPENNTERSNIILSQMLEQNLISKAEYTEAINSELKLNDNLKNESSVGIYSWFTEALIDDIINDLSNKYNISKKAAKFMLFKGGLNIYSTINPQLQSIANDAYESYTTTLLPNNDGTYPESSCIIIDPYSSNVLALIGGRGEKTQNRIFNRAVNAKRPPGSIIKPLSIYTPAIEENIINYSTVFDDTPIKVLNNNIWPKNSPNIYRGLMPVSYAVAHSTNTVAVKVLDELGIDKSYDYLTNKFLLNLDSKKDKALAPLALGQLTNGETLINLTNAYCPFVNGGYIQHPKTYFCVTDNYGNIILDNNTNFKRVVSPQTSYIVTKLLEEVVQKGTAKNISLKNLTSVAGKTGSSSDLKDRWFIGYTPNYICGVWCGYDTPKQLNYNNNPACSFFDKIMCKVYENKDFESFDVPENIVELEYCLDSGMLLTDKCKNDMRGSRIGVGYYKFEFLPEDECKIHKNVIIDIHNGMLADSYTPSYRKRKVVLLNYQREKLFDSIKILDEEYLINNR